VEIGPGVKFIHDDERREAEARSKARALGYTIEKPSGYTVAKAGKPIITGLTLDQLEEWLDRQK
jgi:hypothetical protein